MSFNEVWCSIICKIVNFPLTFLVQVLYLGGRWSWEYFGFCLSFFLFFFKNSAKQWLYVTRDESSFCFVQIKNIIHKQKILKIDSLESIEALYMMRLTKLFLLTPSKYDHWYWKSSIGIEELTYGARVAFILTVETSSPMKANIWVGGETCRLLLSTEI